MMVKRDITTELINTAASYPVVTITGPRQSGKTTLVKKVFSNKTYINLEEPDTREFALSDPRKFLKDLPKGAILDEIQRAPLLLSYIQSIVDEKKENGFFILTGSSQFELMDSVTQSLAGRTGLLKLLPFTFNELDRINKNWSVEEYLFYGFYPRIHDQNIDPTKGYRYYYETYIERDLRQLINIKNLRLFQKFVKLCAGRIGQIFYANQLANEVGVSVPTIQSWLSILETSYIVYLLPPYFTNINKRLIKSPKLYFYDVGLASYLLGIEHVNQIKRDPLRGSLFENLLISELIKYRYNQGLDHRLFFYRDSQQKEIDIIYQSGTNIIPCEIKSADTFHSDMLNGLKYIKKIFPGKINKGYLFYTGGIEQGIEDYNILNYKNMYQIFIVD